jgi:hypothetical protein
MSYAQPVTLPCPHCGKLMQLARVIPGIGALPELLVFHCQHCNEAETVERERAA